MKNFNFLLIAFACACLTSCVSLKRHRSTETSLMTSETNLLKAKEQIIELEKDTNNLGLTLRDAQSQIKQLEEYTAYAQSMLYKQMNEQSSSLDEKVAQIEALEKELARVKAELKVNSEGFSKSSTQLEKVEKLIKAQKQLIVDLRLSAGMITAGFEGQDVDFEAKNGKVKIIIPEKVFFGSSSSTKLTKNGETSVLSLANVLASNAQYNCIVEVHSDDSKSRNNWDFTARRAANITELMIKGGVHPANILPSGRAEFQPVAENDSPENKAKNRRVEIVLAPNDKYINDLLKMY